MRLQKLIMLVLAMLIYRLVTPWHCDSKQSHLSFTEGGSFEQVGRSELQHSNCQYCEGMYMYIYTYIHTVDLEIFVL